MAYVIALDQGTTSCRAIIFDQAGQIVSVAQKEFRQIFPRPGWVEHDPDEIWSTQAGVITEAMERAHIRSKDIAAAGITNQRETAVVWDRSTGRPIGNAIVWQDRRTAAMCDELRQRGLTETIRNKTGLEIDAYFSATKVAWMLKHIDGARQRADAGQLAFGTIDSWLAYRLTDGRLHITDASNAARTMLYDIHAGQWDDELLAVFNIPRAMLPEVRSCSEMYGKIAAPSALEGVPLAGMIGDQQAATMGHVCTEPGLAKNTYGTGCFLLLNTGDAPCESTNRLLSTIAWNRNGVTTYALEGSVFVGGAIVQWLRDGLGIIDRSEDVESLARRAEDSGGVILVPALTGLGAPHWDPHARGLIIGLTRGTTAAHIARAALEGIAFQVADVVEAMQADAGTRLAELRVDGGAACDDLLMQFQSDILQVPVVRPKLLETTALGAAYMAGLATGYWPSVEAIKQNWQIDRVFEPHLSAVEAELRRRAWREAVRRASGWATTESPRDTPG